MRLEKSLIYPRRTLINQLHERQRAASDVYFDETPSHLLISDHSVV